MNDVCSSLIIAWRVSEKKRPGIVRVESHEIDMFLGMENEDVESKYGIPANKSC